jgi:uncharacterized protein (DUF1015 family)
MAVIRPFRALRPDSKVAHLVASVPYDVVNREEAKEFANNFPNSFLRITRSEIELSENVNPYSEQVYLKAKENLHRIIKEAPLVIDDKPYFYLYKLLMDGRPQIGICATFSVDDYDNDIILKHEKTRKEKEDDRTNHIITTETQTGVVFLTYKGLQTVNKIVDIVQSECKPLYDFTSADGICHTLWKVPDEYNTQIITELSAVQKLYIADGHHRAKSASRAREEKRKNNPAHNGSEEYNYFIAVLFPSEQLKILAYNRVVKDLNGRTKEQFLNEVAEKFVVTKSQLKEPKQPNTFGMYIDNEWYSLQASDSIKASLSLESKAAEKLDVSILQNFLLNPILGIDDPRTNKRIDFVGGIRGTKELERLVDSKKFLVAFSLYPVSVEDLMNVSDMDEIMPPKSTWFEPKLRDGLLTHSI